jgi:RimJ/RimL family protein N-acetyltransferase
LFHPRIGADRGRVVTWPAVDTMTSRHSTRKDTMAARPQLTVQPLRSARLNLEPLRVEHAAEAAVVFADARLHRYIGGAPAGEQQLRRRNARQVAGRSVDGEELWLNWMVRHRASGALVGTVQATVRHRPGSGDVAELAWTVATPHQYLRYAREAAGAMVGWLRNCGVDRLVAHVHPEHRASIGVARALGLTPTATVVDGEIRWVGG